MRHYIYGWMMVGALGWAGAADSEAEQVDGSESDFEVLEIMLPASHGEMRPSFDIPAVAYFYAVDYMMSPGHGFEITGWGWYQDYDMIDILEYKADYSPFDAWYTTGGNWADYGPGAPDDDWGIRWAESSLEVEGTELHGFDADVSAELNKLPWSIPIGRASTIGAK